MNRNMNPMITSDPLKHSSQNDLNALPAEENKYLECTIHPKQKIFMFCLNHGPGICGECWNAIGDDSVCNKLNPECNSQPIEHYLRYNLVIDHLDKVRLF